MQVYAARIAVPADRSPAIRALFVESNVVLDLKMLLRLSGRDG